MNPFSSVVVQQFRRLAAVEGKTITAVGGHVLSQPAPVIFTLQPGFASEHMQIDNNPQIEYLPEDVKLTNATRLTIAERDYKVREVTNSADGITKFASLSEL